MTGSQACASLLQLFQSPCADGPATTIDSLLEILRLCTSFSLLSPKDQCVLRCCCKQLHGFHICWLEYQHVITLDISRPSASWWLWRNISSIRQLELIAATQEQISLLLPDAKALTALTLEDCNITKLLPIPNQLERLRIYSCAALSQLGEFPASLKVLDCALSFLEALPALQHTAVEEVIVGDVDGLERIPATPSTVRKLICNNCPVLASIGDVSEGLECLQVFDCISLEALPKLPSSLEELYVDNCSSLRQLPDIAHTAVTGLDVMSCPQLVQVPALPDSLKHLCAIDLPFLQQLPGPLPRNLQDLTLYNTIRFEQLPHPLPELQRIVCHRCLSMVGLPELPSSLICLIVTECSQLRQLPALPPHLQHLRCTYNQQLQQLPALPRSLQTLSCGGCISITELPELPQCLVALECKGCTALGPELDLSDVFNIGLLCIRNCPALTRVNLKKGSLTMMV